MTRPGTRRGSRLTLACAGAFAVCAQSVLLREVLVVAQVGDLAIAGALAAWLAGMGAGAAVGRGMASRLASSGRAAAVAGCLVAAACLLPVAVLFARTLRVLLDVPPGEVMSLGSALLGAVIIALPVTLPLGMLFPLMSSHMDRGGADRPSSAVSLAYLWEGLGSMAGGVVLTFLLLPWIDTLSIVAAAGGLAATGAVAGLARRRAAAIAVLWLCLAAAGPLLREGNRRLDVLRWQSSGLLGGAGGAPARLVLSRDTRYQNLALLESAGQCALYANGGLAFVFPDPHADEHAVHFLMAQRPSAGSVLLLGGNPAGEIPEYLKYPVRRLVHVELDAGIGRAMQETHPAGMLSLARDPRVRQVSGDPLRFVLRCRERFDVIVVGTGDPASASSSRFYTVEFYRAARRLLMPGGFLATSVSTSERLQAEAALLGASVYEALRVAFPAVLVTAESRNRFVAGDRLAGSAADDGITLDRDILFERSQAAGVHAAHFRPEYFLAADELDPEKTARVAARFAEARAAPNRALSPSAHFNQLVMWSRMSGSGEAVLRTVRRLGAWLPVLVVAAALLPALALSACWRRAGGGDRVPAWPLMVVCVAVTATGFAGMAMETMLLYLMQSLCGYVYARVGLVVGLFMLGLAGGTAAGRRAVAAGTPRRAAALLAGTQAAMLALCAAVPLWAAWAVGERVIGALALHEAAVDVLVFALGALVGAASASAFRLLEDLGLRAASIAGLAVFVEQLGAALGALLVGVVLVPALGLPWACGATAGLLALGSAGAAALVLRFRSTRPG